jgi:hypothetical protein
MPRVQCVAWWDAKDRGDSEKRQWCALAEKADPAALKDRTLCGQWVTLRVGCEYRNPTCPECCKLLKEKCEKEVGDERKGSDSD